MTLGHGDEELRGTEVLRVSGQSRGQLAANTGGRHGLMGAAFRLRRRQLHDEATTNLVKRTIESLSEQVTRQGQLKNFEFGVFLGVDQILGKGNQLSRGGSGGVG